MRWQLDRIAPQTVRLLPSREPRMRKLNCDEEIPVFLSNVLPHWVYTIPRDALIPLIPAGMKQHVKRAWQGHQGGM